MGNIHARQAGCLSVVGAGMRKNHRSGAAFETLDRGVMLAALGGMAFNGLEVSLGGMALTATAATTYGLARNRIANLDDFGGAATIPPPPGINLAQFTWICQWLGSRRLFDGLLEDLIDPHIGGTPEAARQYIRETLWLTIRFHIKTKLLSLLWLDRPH